MTLQELLRFVYGLVMGTSVQYVKPRQRFLWPTALRPIDDNLELFLGGSCICGILYSDEGVLLINSNQGRAAAELKSHVDQLGVPVRMVVNTSIYNDFSEGNRLFENARILAPQVDPAFLLSQWGARPERLESIREETRIEFAGESVRLVPVGRAQSPNDLVVYLEKSGVLFTGGLFYNRVHPPLYGGRNLDTGKWIETLQGLVDRFRPRVVVPAEGDPTDLEGVRAFISYLKALSDPNIDFQTCRQNYDWVEIPSYTSLEENFDMVRDHLKTHTTL